MDMDKVIYCPTCNRKMFEWHSKITTPIWGKCKKCRKMVFFNPENQEVSIKPIPPRNTSSGVFLY